MILCILASREMFGLAYCDGVEPMPPITVDEASSLMSSEAWKDLRKALMISLGIGVAGRSAVGILGNMRNNIQRKKEREEAVRPATSQVDVPFKLARDKQADFFTDVPRPWWFAPGAVIGAPLALYGGWAGTGKLLKAYRKKRVNDELESAKQEFEDALASEQAGTTSKFAADLNALAEAWAAGKLDADMEKASASLWDQMVQTYRGVPPFLYTLMSLVGALGAYGGWKMMGDNPDLKKIDAYQEAMRRRRVNRPASLVARPKAISTTPQMEDDQTEVPGGESDLNSTYQKAAALRTAGRWAKQLAPYAAAGAAGAGLTALGAKHYLTRTDSGRNMLLKQLNALASDPRFISGLYDQFIPQFKEEMVRRNPVLGRMAQYFV